MYMWVNVYSSFQLLKQLVDFHKIWYGSLAVRGQHTNLLDVRNNDVEATLAAHNLGS
jgi:hypothetical protein